MNHYYGIIRITSIYKACNYVIKKVPGNLLSGHHANIEKWKRYQALKKTYKQRPDLLEKYTLSQQDIKMLEEIKNEKN